MSTFLTPRTMGLQVLAGTMIFVLIANLLIDRIAHMPKERRRKMLIFCSVFVNLGFLGFFKYFNFFIDSAEDAFRSIGIDPTNLRLAVVLPVGISFYTFQSLSYTIDVYRKRIAPTSHFWDFALFVAYFPPLVAGPIERAWHLLPQLTMPRRIRFAQSMDGIVLILLGLFKKVAIADGVAPAVDSVFTSSGAVSQTDVALATLLFAIQIFCDFSGYSDIARGVSKLFGIELILNFQPALFLEESERVLEVLAHQPQLLAARLPIYLAWRQSAGQRAYLFQPFADYAAWRSLARRSVELRAVGSLSGRVALRPPAS